MKHGGANLASSEFAGWGKSGTPFLIIRGCSYFAEMFISVKITCLLTFFSKNINFEKQNFGGANSDNCS